MERVRRIIDRLPPEDLFDLRQSSEAYETLIAELDRLPPPQRSEFR